MQSKTQGMAVILTEKTRPDVIFDQSAENKTYSEALNHDSN
jgi:hypothetical protein